MSVDSNHVEIAEAFRRLGCSWLDLAAVGQGCPAGLVGVGGRSVLIAIKDGASALTPAQRAFRESWTGGVHVVTNVAEAIAVGRALRYPHQQTVVYVERVYPVFNS